MIKPLNKPCEAVVGLQWGDEGKARVIDYLSKNVNAVVRFQGGSNAGHTVVHNGKKYVFHLIPSGILHKDVICYIGPGVVVDPWSLKDEIEGLIKEGVENVKERIVISCGCHLVLPFHKHMDKIYERMKGDKKIGTTGRGIGPCYADKSLRHGIRLGFLKDEKVLRDQLKTIVPIQNEFLGHFDELLNPITVDELSKSLLEIGEWLKPMIGDVPQQINEGIAEGKSYLFEGAQSVLLDVDFGTWPYVTSSNSSMMGLFQGCGVNPNKINVVWGVSKAYCTRVGEGPFVTELFGDEGEQLRKMGNEYGSTTGRPRRCGWLDLPALKYSVETSSVDHLALTKLDVLSGREKIKVCISYENASHRIYHTDPYLVGSVKPVYKEFPGWPSDIGKITRFNNFPQEIKEFVYAIEEYLNIPVRMISYGASREQAVMC